MLTLGKSHLLKKYLRKLNSKVGVELQVLGYIFIVIFLYLLINSFQITTVGNSHLVNSKLRALKSKASWQTLSAISYIVAFQNQL